MMTGLKAALQVAAVLALLAVAGPFWLAAIGLAWCGDRYDARRTGYVRRAVR